MKKGIRYARLSAAVFSVAIGVSAGHAQTVTWDPTQMNPPTDGSGSWDLLSTNWYDPGSNMVEQWSNTGPQSAVFGNPTSTVTVSSGVGNSVTLNANINVQDIILGAASSGGSNYYNVFDQDDGNETLTLNGNLIKASAVGESIFQLSSPIVLAAGNHVVAVNDTSGAVPELAMQEINNNSLTGAGSITLNNAYNSSGYTQYGTFVLDTDNDYSGGTNIVDGALTANSANALGTGTCVISNQGALEFGGNGTIQASNMSVMTPIEITRNTYTGTNFSDYPDAISSNNTGNAANTVNINGPFVVDSTNAQIAANTSTIIINSNITQGPDVTNGMLTVDGDFAGYVTLNGDNSALTGGIQIIGGVELNVSSLLNLGGPTATLIFNGSGTFHPVGGFISNFGSLNVNYSTFNGGIDVDPSTTFTIGQNLGGAGNSTGTIGERGTGTLDLSGNDILGGMTFWDAGTVTVTGTMSLGSLHLRSPSVNITGAITTTTGYSSFGQDSTGTNGGPDTATVTLSGSGQLTLVNQDFNLSDNAHTTGTLILDNTSKVTAGANSFFGKSASTTSSVTLNDTSTYQANASVSIGTGSLSVGSLTLNGGSVFTVNGSINAGNATGGTALITLNGSSFLNDKTTMNLGGALGTATLTLNGSSTLTVGNQFFIGGGGSNNATSYGALIVGAGTTVNANKGGQQTFAIGGGTNGRGIVTNNGGTINVNGEFWDGTNAGSQGTFNQTAGTTTVNDWFVVGRSGANSTLDLSGGTITKQGADNAYVGENAGVSTMTVEGTGLYSQTTGTFNIGNTSGSTGTVNVKTNGTFNDTSTGTITVATSGSTGTLNVMNNGIFSDSSTGTLDIAEGATANGKVNVQDSGSVLDTNGQVWVGDGNATATATVTISGGTFGAMNNWLAVGRNAGHGTIIVQGGTLEKAGANFLSIGSGTSGNGTVTETSGIITSDSTLVGESGTGVVGLSGGTAGLGTLQVGYANAGSGTVNISGTAAVTASSVTVGTANTAVGTINLNGGSLTAASILAGTSTAATTFNFNGGALSPSANSANFMSGLTTANVQAGGAIINTNSDAITINQPLVHASALGATHDGGLNVSGGGTLTLGGANTYTGGTTVTAGKLLIEPTSPTTSALATGAVSVSGASIVQLADNVSAGVVLGSSNVNITTLSLTGTGTLDIGNNRVIIDYSSPATDPIASIAAWINNGFYGLPGPSIISSDVASDDAASGYSYGIGYADGADGAIAGLPSGEIEIMYTLLGDANLDGTVNSEDFTPFSTNQGLNGGWDKGDFNYDGTVNSEDFTPFSSNLNQSATFAAAAGPLEVSNGISLTNVPEPASFALLSLGGLCALRRRRRHA